MYIKYNIIWLWFIYIYIGTFSLKTVTLVSSFSKFVYKLHERSNVIEVFTMSSFDVGVYKKFVEPNGSKLLLICDDVLMYTLQSKPLYMVNCPSSDDITVLSPLW